MNVRSFARICWRPSSNFKMQPAYGEFAYWRGYERSGRECVNSNAVSVYPINVLASRTGHFNDSQLMEVNDEYSMASVLSGNMAGFNRVPVARSVPWQRSRSAQPRNPGGGCARY